MPTDPTNAGEAGEGFKIPPPTPEQEKEFKQYFMGEFSAAPTNEELIAEAQTHDLSLAKVRLMADRLEAAGKRAEEAELLAWALANYERGDLPAVTRHDRGRWLFFERDGTDHRLGIDDPNWDGRDEPVLTAELYDILRAAKGNAT